MSERASERMSERCERTSERTSERPCTYVPITGLSEPPCRRDGRTDGRTDSPCIPQDFWEGLVTIGTIDWFSLKSPSMAESDWLTEGLRFLLTSGVRSAAESEAE